MSKSSIFGDLTRYTQARINAAAELGKPIFAYKEGLEKFFSWGTPSISTEFQTMIASRGLAIAAPTVSMGSAEPITGGYQPDIIKDSVYRHAISSRIDAVQVRKLEQIMSGSVAGVTPEERKRQIVDIMFGNVQQRVDGVYAKLYLIAMGMLSNGGEFTFDAKSNPEGGIAGVTIRQPFSKSASVDLDWSNPKANILEDITDFALAFDGLEFGRILMSRKRLYQILRNSSARKAILGSDKSASIISPEQLNTWLTANALPPIEVMNQSVKLQTSDGVTVVNPWRDEAVVFAPAGRLGVIESAYADEELRPQDGVAYSKDGRVLISQWQVGKTSGSSYGEHIAAEVVALPVFTEVHNIATLKVGEGASSDKAIEVDSATGSGSKHGAGGYEYPSSDTTEDLMSGF